MHNIYINFMFLSTVTGRHRQQFLRALPGSPSYPFLRRDQKITLQRWQSLMSIWRRCFSFINSIERILTWANGHVWFLGIMCQLIRHSRRIRWHRQLKACCSFEYKTFKKCLNDNIIYIKKKTANMQYCSSRWDTKWASQTRKDHSHHINTNANSYKRMQEAKIHHRGIIETNW